MGGVQQRELGGRRREHRLDAHLEQVRHPGREAPRIQSRARGVPCRRLCGAPGRVEWHLLGDGLQGARQLQVGDQFVLGESRGVGHPLSSAVMEHQVVALLGLRVRAETQLGDEGNNAVLSGPDPLAAQVDPRAVVRLGAGPPADTLARLDHDHRPPRLGQHLAAVNREPCPHHHHVDVLVGHTVLLRCVGIERT